MRSLVTGLIIGLVIGMILAFTEDPGGKVELNISPLTNQKTLSWTKQEWKVASLFPVNQFPLGQTTSKLIINLNRLMGGELSLKYHKTNNLSKSAKIFDLVSSGKLDAAFGSPSLWGKRSIGFRLLDAMPFGPGLEEFITWRNTNKVKRMAKKLYHRFGVHGIICGTTGPTIGGLFKRPVQNISELRDKKIGARGFSAKILSRAGATSVIISPSKALNLYSSGNLFGTLIGEPYNSKGQIKEKLFGIAYFPAWQRKFRILELLINLKKWDKLEPKTKKMMELACSANISKSFAHNENRQFVELKSLIYQGLKIRRWNPHLTKQLKAIWLQETLKLMESEPEFKIFYTTYLDFKKDYSIWQELGYTDFKRGF
ncbi:MAG: hypothetical protein VX617_02505 [Pseudomonadota bacterium]|nr:hypothetical protein [Pseudomonadota bacterium]